MNPFLIYIWGIVDNISVTAGIFSFLLLTGVVILSLYLLGMDDPESKTLRNRLGITGAICLFVGLFTPDSKTIAAMVVIPALIESDAVREDIPQLYDAAIEKLKESLELIPSVEK